MENKIILIEDDEEIRGMITDYLSGEFEVLRSKCTYNGLQQYRFPGVMAAIQCIDFSAFYLKRDIFNSVSIRENIGQPGCFQSSLQNNHPLSMLSYCSRLVCKLHKISLRISPAF